MLLGRNPILINLPCRSFGKGFCTLALNSCPGEILSCWKWFNQVLEEAGVEITEENKDRIDNVFHEYLNEEIRYGKCSSNWSKARFKVDDEETMKSLVDKVREAAKPRAAVRR